MDNNAMVILSRTRKNLKPHRIKEGFLMNRKKLYNSSHEADDDIGAQRICPSSKKAVYADEMGSDSSLFMCYLYYLLELQFGIEYKQIVQTRCREQIKSILPL